MQSFYCLLIDIGIIGVITFIAFIIIRLQNQRDMYRGLFYDAFNRINILMAKNAAMEFGLTKQEEDE